MIDNKKVNDNHQQGIARKVMRKGDLKPGQGGKMGVKLEEAHWKQGESLVPRRA